MERDKRLTGFLRGQTDRVAAPPGFELNNPWKVGLAELADENRVLTKILVREPILLDWRPISFRYTCTDIKNYNKFRIHSMNLVHLYSSMPLQPYRLGIVK